MLRDLIDGVSLLAPIGAAVGLLWYVGRDRDGQADDHDVSDYRPAPGSRLLDPRVDVTAAYHHARWQAAIDGARRRLRAGAVASLEVLPPAPAGTTAPLSVYAELVVADVMRARYGTTDPAVIAGQMLREVAADEQHTESADADVIWNRADDLCGSCDAGLPMSCTCRDLTGAFPVVRAA
ncbi:hypothetical protein [Micromonospora globbae]|uniref:hypothetical protein n=1 Tax=Micromonospora globbae TaxID=1894969 RepID=UPI0034279D43